MNSSSYSLNNQPQNMMLSTPKNNTNHQSMYGAGINPYLQPSQLLKNDNGRYSHSPPQTMIYEGAPL